MTAFRVKFAPGCFDNWEGTQQELDDFVAQINKMAESGEFMKNAIHVDLDELEQLNPEFYDSIINDVDHIMHTNNHKRKLN